MLIEGKIKRAICKSNQHVLVNINEGFVLSTNESITGEWKCDNCGCINELEIKNNDID